MDKGEEKEVKKEEEKKEDAPPDLTEEDQKVKDEVDELVAKVKDTDPALVKTALNMLTEKLRTASGTVTSIPRPLKFLRAHYADLKADFAARPESLPCRGLYADLLSLLSMSCEDDESTQCAEFVLKGGMTDFEKWGHEFLRHLSGKIALMYAEREAKSESVEDLNAMIAKIIPLDFQYNSEPQACDLLLETGQLGSIIQHCTAENYNRVTNYIESSARYFKDSEQRVAACKVAYDIYKKLELWPQAMYIALSLDSREMAEEVFATCEDEVTKKQLAFQVSQQSMLLDFTGDDDMDEIVGKSRLSEFFLYTARDLNAMGPKTPEEIFKKAMEDQRTSTLSAGISSHTQNLASTFVNAFANCAFGVDKLMTTDQANEWLHKNKDHRMMSAAASLGMVMLWDVDSGLAQVDKFFYSNEESIKAGALLAVGILHCGVRNDCDPAMALLEEYFQDKPRDLRVAAICGLGLAYSGSRREDIKEVLLPMVADADTPLEVATFAALSLGLTFVGSCDESISEILTTTLMERKEEEFSESIIRFISLALGLLFLGQQEKGEVAVTVCSTLNPKIAKYCEMTVKTCAYAGTGNVEQVKLLMKELVEKIEKEEDAAHQAVSVLGLGLIAMGEQLGAAMIKRTFEHILQYGDPVMRRAIPLALAMVSVSNPSLEVMDTLGKLTHDPDEATSMVAILALGLAGAGTNNARIGNMLRQLANYYAKEANHLFLVRIAQGLLFLGKGLLTLSPMHGDQRLMNPVSVAGLLVVLHACLDIKGLVLGRHHFLLYYIVCAVHPRMMLTVDEDLKPLQASVRVGTAVDTVAVPGRPKRITGFQTHNSPVLLQHNDRAELASDQYRTVAPVLEGTVILTKNPEFKEGEV